MPSSVVAGSASKLAGAALLAPSPAATVAPSRRAPVLPPKPQSLVLDPDGVQIPSPPPSPSSSSVREGALLGLCRLPSAVVQAAAILELGQESYAEGTIQQMLRRLSAELAASTSAGSDGERDALHRIPAAVYEAATQLWMAEHAGEPLPLYVHQVSQWASAAIACR